MQSNTIFPLSVTEAFRLYREHPMYQQFQAKHQKSGFDRFLSTLSIMLPDTLVPLSEGQVRGLVELWIRIRAADEKIKGSNRVPALTTKEVIRRLAVLDRLTDCLPDISGIYSDGYWNPFINICAQLHGANIDCSGNIQEHDK